jgi:hypothetical protein
VDGALGATVDAIGIGVVSDMSGLAAASELPMIAMAAAATSRRSLKASMLALLLR